ncbi:MAG: hypothetical protein OXU37_07485 [Thaumarchaeota archaeon]|nr:hypothetical protein [Nitrososphaerota archaeon]
MAGDDEEISTGESCEDSPAETDDALEPFFITYNGSYDPKKKRGRVV